MATPGLMWDKDETFLTAAFKEVMRPDPRDRDNLPLGLDPEDVFATWDMVLYNWQHACSL